MPAPGKPGESFQETLARTEEREWAARIHRWGEERNKAAVALVVSATAAAFVLVPVWAAIFGGAVWVFRLVSGAPVPW